jgi:hypothetical protein
MTQKTTSKLTKTQAQLLEYARKHDGQYSVTTGYGHGPKGGKKQHGMRERDALLTLETLGLVEITDRQPWQEYNSGWRQHGTSIAFKIKE